MEMTRKRITAFTGMAFATLGFIILIAGWATADSKWKDENCCDGKTCNTCGGYCGLLGGSWFEDGTYSIGGSTLDCCYGTTDTGPDALIFLFGAVAMGVVLMTLCLLECGDKFCCECCQKCTAIILAIENITGLIFVIILIVVLLDTNSSNIAGCDDTTIYHLVGVNGIMVAGTIFLALGVICSLIVTFIECCCDDANKEATASP